MFKFVVLSVLLAAVAAEPGFFVPAPLAYTSTYVSPATTTISQQASSVVHPSPLAYTATAWPYAHLIKKRSAPLLAAPGYLASPYFAHGSYIAPGYVAPTPLATSYSYSTPLVSAPVHYTAPVAHLIKKRSVAPLVAPLATSYITPTSYIPTTYAATPYYSSAYASPYYTAPLAYPSPFYIKK